MLLASAFQRGNLSNQTPMDDTLMLINSSAHPLTLVGGLVYPTPLKNDGVSSSVGMMTFPIYMESHKIHVPKHQAVFIIHGIHHVKQRKKWALMI